MARDLLDVSVIYCSEYDSKELAAIYLADSTILGCGAFLRKSRAFLFVNFPRICLFPCTQISSRLIYTRAMLVYVWRGSTVEWCTVRCSHYYYYY